MSIRSKTRNTVSQICTVSGSGVPTTQMRLKKKKEKKRKKRMGRGLTFTEWMGNKGLVGCLSHERKVLKENAERRPESRKCTLLHTIVN